MLSNKSVRGRVNTGLGPALLRRDGVWGIVDNWCEVGGGEDVYCVERSRMMDEVLVLDEI